MLARIVLPLAVFGAIIGFGLWISLGGGGSQPLLPDEPAVEGRLFWGSTGWLGDGSHYTSRCEADAHVVVERDTIIKILEHGNRPPITVGEKIDRDPSHDPTYTEEDFKERGELPTNFALWVYRDDEGVIRTGCSPESIIIIEGVAKTVAEWEAEGQIPTPRPAGR
jgi:hypothetical protein